MDELTERAFLQMDEADPWYSENKLFSSGVVFPEESLFKAFASRNDAHCRL